MTAEPSLSAHLSIFGVVPKMIRLLCSRLFLFMQQLASYACGLYSCKAVICVPGD